MAEIGVVAEGIGLAHLAANATMLAALQPDLRIVSNYSQMNF